jgi:hypothetical protein
MPGETGWLRATHGTSKMVFIAFIQSKAKAEAQASAGFSLCAFGFYTIS